MSSRVAILLVIFACLALSARSASEIFCRQKHSSAGHYQVHLDFPDQFGTAAFSNFTFSQSDMATFALTNPRVKPTCVDLSSNRLIVWPELNCSTSVQYLNLSSNRLSQWNLANFPDLRVLDVSYNSLNAIDLNALLRMPSLEVLYLHGNLMHIFSDLRRSPSLKTVILSPEDWHARQNIDFGPYPIHMLMSTATAANAWRFSCSSRAQSESIDLLHCREVFISDLGRVSSIATCLSCYNCTDFIPAPVKTTVINRPASNTSSTHAGDGGNGGGGAFVITTIVLLVALITALASIVVVLLLKMRHMQRERTQRPMYYMPERVATISKASLREVREPVVPMLFDRGTEKFCDVQSPHLLYRRERQSFDMNITDSSV